jgi:threonine dehydratase
MSRPVTPVANGVIRDGLYSGVQTPRTPVNGTYALTEYAAFASPPTESVKSKATSSVPEAFLLPNGHPDVYPEFSCLELQLQF